MPSRSFLLPVAAALAALVVLVLVLRDGRPDVEIERGLPRDGLPLRGSLADDTEAIEDAVDAWRENDGPGADADDRDRRFDEDDEVHVLWIGEVPDRTIAVLEQDDRIAEVRRRESDGEWRVVGISRREREIDPAPLSFRGGVLLPEGGAYRYVAAERDRFADDTTVVDGLLVGEGSFGGEVRPGFVFPTRASGGDGTTIVLVRSVGLRRIPADEYDRFLVQMDDGSATALLAAIDATATDDDAGPAQVSGLAPTVSQVWSGPLPGRPLAFVVAEGDRSLGLGVDDPEREDDDVTQSVPLGRGPGSGPGLGAGGGPGAVGAGRVETAQGARILVAGTPDVRRLELRAGTRRWTGPGPVLVVDAPWLGRDATARGRDVVVFGETADGAVVAPLPRG